MMKLMRLVFLGALFLYVVVLDSCKMPWLRKNEYCSEEPRSMWDWEPPFYYGNEGTISPDGRSLAFVYHGNRWGTDTVGLYFCDLETEEYRPVYTGLPGEVGIISTPDFSVEGDSLTQLTFSGENFYPRWSPDGRKISFHEILPVDSSGVWIMSADGSGMKWVVGGYEADWSPDGKHLIFSGLGGSVYRADTLGGISKKFLT